MDAGCGIGHWGQLLAPYLPQAAKVIGVDREKEWIKQAAERARHRGLERRFSYCVGDVCALDFPDHTFDLVTCQTLLIHVADPLLVIREFVRVLKPGGILIMVEPNNIASSMVRDSIDFGGDIDALVESVRFRLICERGKQNLGEGHNSVGDLIPGYCALAGLSDVKVYQSDKASPLIPPYATKGEQVLLAQYQTWEENQKAAFNKKELLKYHRAGGGSDEAFERQWLQHQTTALAFKNGITAHALHSAGGVITYLTSGRKKKNAGGG